MASVPSVGIFYAPVFVSSDRIIDSIAPMLNRWTVDGKADFAISVPDPLKVEIRHNNGFTYAVESNRVSIAYQHRVKFRNISGGRPVAELISSPLPFSGLLDAAIDDIIELTLLLPIAKSSSINRVGIVSSTHADEDDMPPGVRKLIDFLAKPWPGALSAYQVSIVGNLPSSKEYEDRCIYGITKPDDDSDIPNYKFDWQRGYVTSFPINKDTLQKEFQRNRKAAIEYFEKLAIGDEFDVLG
ncbi:hypothetical protein [Mesorhizobium sp. WSM3864]|uniref:hypothetical protein n=1 Tax=Mesorhizobium sp. WSM3864 TaxID=2029404 RepID=UPI0011409A3B|nr:hypothetical protein [Mesorhizobium sp. WSM3864]